MADRTVDGLHAAIKALQHTVAPAIDPANPLANEQLRMVCGYLAMVAGQLPLRAARIGFELRAAVALADALAPLAPRCDEALAAELARHRDAGHELLDDPWRSEAATEQATAALNAAASALVRAAAAGADAELRRAVERCTLAQAGAGIAAQRAWFAPLGLDPERASLPTLADALAGVHQGADGGGAAPATGTP